MSYLQLVNSIKRPKSVQSKNSDGLSVSFSGGAATKPSLSGATPNLLDKATFSKYKGYEIDQDFVDLLFKQMEQK